MEGIDRLHLSALAATALRGWWRLREHDDVPPAYSATPPRAPGLRGWYGKLFGTPPGLPRTHAKMMRTCESMALGAARRSLLGLTGRVDNCRPYDRSMAAVRALMAESPGFAAANNRYSYRHRTARWPDDPDASARLVFQRWEGAEPGVPRVVMALLQGAYCLNIVARAEIVAWRVMWGSGGHFDPSHWWCEHRDACDALRELGALAAAFDPAIAVAMQRDAERLRERGPLLEEPGDDIPRTIGRIDPSRRGPLGPLWPSPAGSSSAGAQAR